MKINYPTLIDYSDACFELYKSLKYNEDKFTKLNTLYLLRIKCSNCQSLYLVELNNREINRYFETFKLPKKIKPCCVGINSITQVSKLKFTIAFINNYLINSDSNLSFDRMLYDYELSDSLIIANIIRKMDYKTEFLCSQFWKILSSHKKALSQYRCSLCTSDFNLNLHHSNYLIRGYEIICLDQLSVLCNKCHNNFHISQNQYQNVKPTSQKIFSI